MQLTYRDVRKILALVDAWPNGRIHFEAEGLVVDAITRSDDAAHDTIAVLSPAVGIFKPAPLAATVLPAGTCVGHIEAPLRSTPVVTSEAGRIASVVAAEGFVEYGQSLLLMERA